jgi:alanyl-tRNA synthetase
MNLTTNEIRQRWLDFFQSKGYNLIQPASLVPENDPSILWINSGVAAIKKYFKNPLLAPSRNLVNCQRVIRTDDLKNINAESYHQTLFEMLGVFSIGGNFKKETIPFFWEFFTSKKWLGLEKNRLFITVYEGDKETKQIWDIQEGIILEQIVFGDRETNFWDMGDGPCGPNTEIYYDFKTNGKMPKNARDLDNKRFLEICNIVFSGFDHKGKDYLPLKEKCVDVGAGLERIAMVIQGKKNTFEIDLWNPIIELINNPVEK